ncbi:hypothetical protein E2542_SST20086 [Spatholobus suberectus]|nr:hypothetical protein E2542_SST20086 [Spatholobus suberectus]
MLTKSKDSAANHLSLLIPLPLMHLVLPFHAKYVHPKLGNDWTLIISKPLGGHSTYTKVKFWTVPSVVLTALAATRPSLVDCRVLPSPTYTEKATHGPLKVLRFLRNLVMTEKANTEDNISNRVLIENQFQTMSSGPSRRGSGH